LALSVPLRGQRRESAVAPLPTLGQINMSIASVILRFISFVALLCIAGCATGPTFTPVDKVPDGKAMIYVYRMFNVGGVASSHRIYANGELVADFANASYYPFIVSPGKITFSSKSESISPIIDLANSKDNLLTIEAIAGQTYYAEFHIGDTWGPKLFLVSQEVGSKRIQKCHLEN
jgi:hypothetical protein